MLQQQRLGKFSSEETLSFQGVSRSVIQFHQAIMAASALLTVDTRPQIFQELDAMRVRSGLRAQDFALILHDYAEERFPEANHQIFTRRTQSAPGILSPEKSLDSPTGDSGNVATLLETKETTKYDTFVYPSGNIDDFHKGLSERIGFPHLEFFAAMEQEHCRLPGADVEFTTRNYGIR